MQKEHNFALKQRKKLKKRDFREKNRKKTGSPGREALPGEGRRVCQIPEVSGTGTGSRGTPTVITQLYLARICHIAKPLVPCAHMSHRCLTTPYFFNHSIVPCAHMSHLCLIFLWTALMCVLSVSLSVKSLPQYSHLCLIPLWILPMWTRFLSGVVNSAPHISPV